MKYTFRVCPKNSELKKEKGNFFILLFIGRTGSTFVLDVFNQHPKVIFRGEMLGTFQGKRNSSLRQSRWIYNLFSSENSSKYTAIGFKTKFFDIPDLQAFCQTLDDLKPKILFSRRRNLIKLAISTIRINERAEIIRNKMGEKRWLNSQTANEVWNIKTNERGIGKIYIDIKQIDNYVKLLQKSARNLSLFINSLNLDIIEFDYDDICDDTEIFFDKMFHLLGVDPIPYEVNYVKHTPQNLSDAIENYDELMKYYKGTKLKKFLV